jgi:hypothetical protein
VNATKFEGKRAMMDLNGKFEANHHWTKSDGWNNPRLDSGKGWWSKTGKEDVETWW